MTFTLVSDIANRYSWKSTTSCCWMLNCKTRCDVRRLVPCFQPDKQPCTSRILSGVGNIISRRPSLVLAASGFRTCPRRESLSLPLGPRPRVLPRTVPQFVSGASHSALNERAKGLEKTRQEEVWSKRTRSSTWAGSFPFRLEPAGDRRGSLFG